MTLTTQAILQKHAANISDVLAESSKEMSFEVKQRTVLNLLQDALAATGKLFLIGGLPVHVDHKGNISRLLPGKDLDRFLNHCGFIPGAANWDVLLSRTLQCRSDIPPNFVHSLAHFDSAAFVLYLNEFSGFYLRCESDGIWSRLRVGEFDVLFDAAEEPHEPVDLNKINASHGPALAWSEDSPLVKYIFSVGKFAEDSGIGRLNCITVLLLFMLAIVFKERVLVLPVCRLCGLTGTRKTAICVAIGWLLSGLGMKFCSTSCPENIGDVQNALINAKAFWCWMRSTRSGL
jgi:hypothetical protein